MYSVKELSDGKRDTIHESEIPSSRKMMSAFLMHLLGLFNLNKLYLQISTKYLKTI